ncbi:unnamed protein product [Prunus armeniaca]
MWQGFGKVKKSNGSDVQAKGIFHKGSWILDEDGDDLITFKMFHGGGSISWFDYCEANYMSMLEIWAIAKDFGYKDSAEFYDIVAQIRKVVHIGCDDSLLGIMRTVPKRNKREQLQKLGDVHVQELGDVHVQEQDDVHVQEQDDVHEQDDVNVQESEDEEANTVDYTKDDIWFDGYVDDITVDMDPNAEEDNDGDVTGGTYMPKYIFR